MKIKTAIERFELNQYSPFNKTILTPSILEKEIFVVVLTGGPCAGKTTCLNKARRQSLAMSNCITFVAQEAATHLKNANINFVSAGADNTFQELIIDHQLTSERDVVITAIKFVANHPQQNAICIFDRSIMDGQAYFDDPNQYLEILKEYNLDREKVYNRADMVLFLRSAAVGAEFAYTTSDGTPRDESPEMARIRDANVYNAWKDHPNFKEINNEFIFSEKMDRAISIIFNLANIKVPALSVKRFIVDMPDSFELYAFDLHIDNCFDQTFFLHYNANSPHTYYALRIRRSGNTVSYNIEEQTWDTIINPDTNLKVEAPIVEKMENISYEELSKYLMQVRTDVKPLERIVYTFNLDDTIYCELSQYSCNKAKGYLKVSFPCSKDEIPRVYEKLENRFIIRREVTYGRRYSEFKIAESEGRILDLD